MQCPSCGFQNLPGLTQCARCLSRLQFADVDVRPYRASDRFARLRGWRAAMRRAVDRVGPTRRWFGVPIEAISGRIRRTLTDMVPRCRPTWLAASLIPGLGLILAGRKRMGCWILGGYTITLICSVIFMSSIWVICTALMLGLHTMGMVNCLLLNREVSSRLVLIFTTIAVFCLLQFALYPAASWTLQGVARLDQIAGPSRSGVFQEGDVVMVEGRWLASGAYKPGDIVSYQMPRQQGSGWYIAGGAAMDRILAGPGEHVVCKDGRLFIDGRRPAAERGLLSPVGFPHTLDVVIPADSYFIYPSLARINYPVNNATASTMRMSASIVPARNIQGRVLMIVNPLWRIGRP